jgi:hypothetical protein
MTGSIPSKLKIFSRAPINVTTSWDNDDEGVISKVLVTPVFVTDATNLKTQATAKAWTESRRWCYETKQTVHDPASPVVEIHNAPFSALQVVSMEKRSQGGRAYKAIAYGKFYVDLREDVLLDALITVGVQPGGLLNGSYVFAMVNSEMKVVRVGSMLHTKLVELTSLKVTSSIAAKDFIPGYTYFRGTKDDDKGLVYMGAHYAQTLDGEDLREGRLRWGGAEISLGSHGRTWLLKVSPRHKVHVFLDPDVMTRPENATYWHHGLTILKALPKMKRRSNSPFFTSPDNPDTGVEACLQRRLDGFHKRNCEGKQPGHYISDYVYYLQFRSLVKDKDSTPEFTVEQLLNFLR